jgi:DNA processing protein
MREDMLYWVWLSMLHKITPGEKKELLGHFSSPENIWSADINEIASLPFMDSRIFAQLTDNSIKSKSESMVIEIESKGINMVTILDDDYPALLREIYDPPVLLYTRGKLIRDELAVAIVGSRRVSPYGVEISEALSYSLAGKGITIISGMARGVDSWSHRGALEAGGRTIAVLGCGVDVVYPPENAELMKRIEKDGAVISEYPPGMQPLPMNFIARNRIISGISVGTVVIEAGNRSGSLITAAYALEQGREVFAVPGNIDSPGSKGTNRLIKDGAKIVTCVEDILDELGFLFPGKTYGKEQKAGISINLDDREAAVVRLLKTGVSHIDRISREAAIPINELEPIMLLLEMKGIVQQNPGRLYRLKQHSL